MNARRTSLNRLEPCLLGLELALRLAEPHDLSAPHVADRAGQPSPGDEMHRAAGEGDDAAQFMADLQRQLESDGAAREAYLDYMFLHAQLFARFADPLVLPAKFAPSPAEAAESAALQPNDMHSAAAPHSPAALAAPHSAAAQPAPYRRLRERLFYSVSIASIALAVSLAIMAMISIPSFTNRPPSSAPAVAPGLSPAAQIVGLREAVWSQGAKVFRLGDSLAPGEALNLQSGMVEIRYANGARVVVDGPALFSAEQSSQGRLERGSLLAVVPPQAIGFMIQTPTVRIVDLGTRFGVSVDDAGEVEVHVLDGNVAIIDDAGSAALPALPAGQPAAQVELGRGQSVRIAPGRNGRASPPYIAIASDAGRFQRLQPPLRVPPVDHPASPLAPLVHFRLGEDDRTEGSAAIEPGDEARAFSQSSLGAARLERFGALRYREGRPRRGNRPAEPAGWRYALRYTRPAEVPGSRLAMTFDGAPGDYFAGPFVDLDADDHWVLEAWARAASNDELRIVAYNGTTGFNGFGIMQQGAYWGCLFGGVTQQYFENAPVQINHWTHLALVCEGETARLFVDGQLAGTAEIQQWHRPSGKFYIGGRGAEPFAGEIDEVRLSRLARPYRPEFSLHRGVSDALHD